MANDASSAATAGESGPGGTLAPASDGPSLEELDGTPIRRARSPQARPGWLRAWVTGTSLTAGRPALWLYALIAFLLRGGLLVMLAPMVALPTFVGLANLVGPTSVTASGPTERLVWMIVGAVAGVAIAIVGGSLGAAAAEVALYRATVADDPDDPASGLLSDRAPLAQSARRSVLRIALARLVLLAPVVAALSIGVPEYVGVGYRELLLPADLGVPLPIRILLGAPGPSLLLAVAWLAGELVGGLAARRIALLGGGVLRSIGSAILDLVLSPVSAILTLVIGLVGSVVVVVPGLLLTGFAWDRARVVLVDRRDAVDVLLATMVLAAAWGVALLLAGLAAAWRSTPWTVEVARRPRRPAIVPRTRQPSPVPPQAAG